MPSVWGKQSCKCRHKLGAEPGTCLLPEQRFPKQHSTCQGGCGWSPRLEDLWVISAAVRGSRVIFTHLTLAPSLETWFFCLSSKLGCALPPLNSLAKLEHSPSCDLDGQSSFGFNTDAHYPDGSVLGFRGKDRIPVSHYRIGLCCPMTQRVKH